MIPAAILRGPRSGRRPVVAAPTPGGAAYPNGYARAKLLAVPHYLLQGTADLNRFAAPVWLTHPDLRTVANGGYVQSASGWDIRFELPDGTKLKHELKLYVPATGELLAYVLLPVLKVGTDTFLDLYFGKAGLAATEAEPTAVWADWLAVIDTRTGADRSGHGRDFAVSSVGSGTLVGPCGSFAGNSVLSTSDVSWLNGLGSITQQLRWQLGSAMLGTDHGATAQGALDTHDSTAGIGIRLMSASFDGATLRPIHAKVQVSGGGDAYTSSDGNRHTTDPQTVHATWQDGEAIRLFIDGAEPPTSGSQVTSGVTGMATGKLYIGLGNKDTGSGAFTGLIDEVRYRSGALSPAWCAAEAAFFDDPLAMLGIGASDAASDAVRSPVALPVAATCVRDGSVDVEVAGFGYDPQGLALTLSAVGGAVSGSVTSVGGKARFTPSAGLTGKARFDFTLSNGTKLSTGRCRVTVSPPAGTVVQAQADSASCLMNGSVSLDPRANDLPATGLTITALGSPAHGTALIQGSGTSVSYTPALNYVGPDSFSYTVSDGASSASATISINVQSPSPVVANPDQASTMQGLPVDVSPLANDTGPGTLSISAFTQPAAGQGTVAQSGATLRFTPAQSFVGTASFTYTATNGLTSATAAITVQVRAAGQELPTPTATRRVPEDYSTIQAAVNAAQKGEEVSVAGGTWAGFNTARAGVVVRSRIMLAAKIASGSINLNHADCVLWGFEVKGVGVGVTGDRARTLRNIIHDVAVGIAIEDGADVETAYNELYNISKWGIRHRPVGNLLRPHTHHNWLHDWIGAPAGTNVHEGMQVGTTKSESNTSIQALVEYNLFENVGIDPEAISIKSSDNTVRFNTILNSTAAIENRHGERNTIAANWVEGSQGIRVHDRDNKVLGNKLVNTSQGLRIMAGSVTPDQWDAGGGGDGSQWPAATNTIVAGNDCNKTEIGSEYSHGFAVATTGTVVEAHTGPITNNHCTPKPTPTSPTTSRTIPRAVKFSRSDVGPNA